MRAIALMVLFLALGLPATSARAQMVYRCVGKGGAVSLQSAPCPANQKTAKVVFAPPEPVRPVHVPSHAPASASRSQVSSYTYQSSQAGSGRDRQRQECAAAKAHRDDTLRQVGMARTHDLLRQLDNIVYDACKGL